MEWVSVFLYNIIQLFDHKFRNKIIGKTLAEVQGFVVDGDLDELDPAQKYFIMKVCIPGISSFSKTKTLPYLSEISSAIWCHVDA